MSPALANRSTEAGAVSLQFAPLDVPLHVEVAQAFAADPIATACNGWGGAANGKEALRMRVELWPTLAGTGHSEMRVEGPVVRIRGPGVFAHAKLDRGVAHCAVSADYLEEPSALHQEVIEPLVLMLLTRRDRTPLHASGPSWSGA